MNERRLTVAQVLPELESGGVERGTLEVAGERARRGHRSIVISGGGQLVEQLIADGSQHVQWPLHRKSSLTLRYVRPMRRVLRDRRVDVLDVRSRVPAWVAIWCITDGKAGHLNQMRGLIRALAEQTPVDVHTIRAPSRVRSLLDWARGRFPAGKDLPRPTLILGAGHATHPAVLAARRAFGGRSVVLMKPGLPIHWFDMCLIPEHDGVKPRSNVVLTRGVLNNLKPTSKHTNDEGLILIGGPSSHYGWSDARAVEQVQEIVRRHPHHRWTLTTSRRTPTSLLPRLRALQAENLTIVPFEQTTPSWVPEHLAAAGAVWVTEDSVSMVYEAMTSGAMVGLLSVPQRRSGRVAQGLQRLVDDGWVTPFRQWRSNGVLSRPPHELDEAARCTEQVRSRLLEGSPQRRSQLERRTGHAATSGPRQV